MAYNFNNPWAKNPWAENIWAKPEMTDKVLGTNTNSGTKDNVSEPVKVKTFIKEGIEYILISCEIVLIDETKTLQNSELNQLAQNVKEKLQETFTGSSETRKWSLTANIRVGTETKQDMLTSLPSEATIRLKSDSAFLGDGLTLDGLLVSVKKTSPILLHTIVHEFGHLIGLPHVWPSFVLQSELLKKVPYKESLKYVSINFDLIGQDNPLVGNLMTPGTFPERFQGYQILESQILHIKQDYPKKLNNLTNTGGDEPWGTYNTDAPLYNIAILSALKNPANGVYTLFQKLEQIR